MRNGPDGIEFEHWEVVWMAMGILAQIFMGGVYPNGEGNAAVVVLVNDPLGREGRKVVFERIEIDSHRVKRLSWEDLVFLSAPKARFQGKGRLAEMDQAFELDDQAVVLKSERWN